MKPASFIMLFIDITNEASYDAMSRSQSPFIAYAMAVPSMADWNKKCVSNFHPLKQPLPKVKH